ncbi:beta-ketoacyl-ACP synthase [Candidatus Thalassolituus haligoni]|uniref:beta-ketoacyl-ACP synthase n=1 Tax=Candidatus Thalassolituus haligoni TaxID=3100113 RepID=UPI00351756E5|tara:strand:- start:39395 stop:40618 length:1224 start_codon:yes stop_codon:yes gene_type:complete
MKRVVITGMSAISPIGQDWDTIAANLRALTTGIRYIESWDKYEGLNTRLGGPVDDFEKPSHYTRKAVRSMGRMSVMATRATELALQQAGLLDDERIQDGRMGVAVGSSSGTPDAIGEFGQMLFNHSVNGLNATSYVRMMPHTAPVNIGVFFGLKGRIITTSSACTSGSQGIGYAYEAIKYGHQQMMVAGGCEELSATQAAVFDTLFATSTNNANPDLAPRPFDQNRDGLVIGEGAGIVILETLESALERGATILAEIVGFGTNSDGAHITQPNATTMQVAMEMSLRDAGLTPADIGYVSAHGTATDRGDVAESQATFQVLGKKPISSFKSFTGHTLGACGALEAIVSIHMMNEGWFHATANLTHPDSDCADLDYIMGQPRHLETDHVMSNNFAFGGINTSLILKRWR